MIPHLIEISNEAYHADPVDGVSLSHGILHTLITKSPFHAWLSHPKLNPDFKPNNDARFDIGSIAHAALLEQSYENIVVVDADDWRTKAAREAKDAAWKGGKKVILAKNMEAVVKMVDAAKVYVANSEIAGIFDDGQAEASIIWRDPIGCYCRIRPDWLKSSMSICLDYKTTQSAHPEAFIRQMPGLGYDTQAAFYSRGVRSLSRHGVTFVFLVQEITPPYSCSLVGLSEPYKTIAEAKVQENMILWTECLVNEKWPAYPNRICYAEPRAWQLMEHESKQLDELMGGDE